ncbi:UNVERIFIED_CONTAM: hypothetical protein GTU68_062079 [Idotea baltica]|nr:hypothetical protein [Idotea baltica]
MTKTSYKELTINGLWKNNPALVQLLGLCPLLGTSNSVVNAMGLSIATILVLICSNVAVSLIRNVSKTAVRLPVFVMIIATLTTCIELLMQAFTYELYQVLGIFIPLITTNCIILGRAEGFAAKNDSLRAAYDGLIMGIGFGIVLFIIGFVRELLGTGAIFNNMQLLFGHIAINWKIIIFSDYKGFLIAILPPGAFIILGFLIAFKNYFDQKESEKKQHSITIKDITDHSVSKIGTNL